ncbi:MAG TPA: 3-methyl-2-oxobutanoate hydroxymethyltransferase [Myxococcota bacterium]|nr:3-methyl-2-oxobutanoate hydroxymethyltransferase [Myxococcota bacterium]HRY94947.1 3-methyl-2-oxobutanoate hydroxymethyltransferase [Myxococcota bacterium]HSA19990.1 3-methyl-2-oxobutanoate hydroxymethyltransferase [Myxococcota bacterium]
MDAKDTTRVELTDFLDMKRAGRPITMLTAYDTPCARLADRAGVDAILVGDSLSNVVLGHRDTLPVTMEEMLHHTRAVSRGASRALVVADMPFGSYQISREEAVRNGVRFLKEAGAQAVKLEGAGPHVATVRALTEAGVPVVGHLGLTPQTAGMLGGYKLQGRTAEAARRIFDGALELEAAGAFLLVLELVPARLGALVSRRLRIPTIGIGAGAGTDGQVLVFHDLLGFEPDFQPRHLKRYAELGREIERALGAYCAEVRARSFPDEAHSFRMPDEEWAALEAALGPVGARPGEEA